MTENNDKAYNLYAGFVRRLGAFLIDGVIALILSLIAAQVITFLSIVVLNMLGKSTYNFVMVENYPGVIGNYIPVVIYNLYNSMMDSSKTQATLGKLVTQIKTVDINGMKVPFLNSFLKYLIMWSIPMLFLDVLHS